MSGNYDYPPASRASRPNRSREPSEHITLPLPSATPSPIPVPVPVPVAVPAPGEHLQHLRQLLTSERNRDTSARALETLDQEINEYRPFRGQDPTSFDQNRTALDRYMQNYWSRREAAPHDIYPPPELRSYVGPPRPANRAARNRQNRSGGRQRTSSLLDEGVPPLVIPPIMPLDREDDRHGDRSRAKRRKLETDDSREGLQSFRYGQYGQVVPGPLRMELASCDGGTYEPEGECSWPQNVLRNDSSVYCTKSDRCNLILKHRGDSPFCLKKIVINAPRSGYDAPIQEGMVFVSMSCDELLSRTAAYQVEYPNSRRQRRNRRSGLQPSQEYLNAYRTPLQSLDRRGLAGQASHRDSETDLTSGTPHLTNDFHITTEYDNPSERNDRDTNGLTANPPSIADLARWQMEQMEDDLLGSDSDDSESDDDDPAEVSAHSRRRRDLQRRVRAMEQQQQQQQQDASRRRAAGSSTVPPALPGSRPQEPRSGPNTALMQDPDLLRPHARFFIERAKSTVSIKFDPPP
ncbi:hypothetical protein BDW42DRAFT_178289 [Aspergillus taichungensis]|uniref:Uncharacterized protein n=1 Tax=Aspergillus taichungensis TaxID=482145 RepID=A0A2J5HHY4_9EURO|nr:hypothetical protein BDW42DRAFT_178289 [Aspergillus taichungensis]